MSLSHPCPTCGAGPGEPCVDRRFVADGRPPVRERKAPHPHRTPVATSPRGRCEVCGAALPLERRQAGFTVCTDAECQAKGMKGPNVVVLGVHKSNPQVVSLDSSEVTARTTYMNR